MHFVGGLATFAIFVAVGIYSGKKVANAADFANASRRAGSTLVVGTITGTLVGGASTIGTAQLAFTYGLSAWWFTLGAGIACLILGVAFTRPLRESEGDTIEQMISKEYGTSAGVITSVLGTIGLLINIIAQLLSFSAIVNAFLPEHELFGFILGVGLMLCYVVFGGVLSAGILGVVKLLLLYFAVGAGGLLALQLMGGFASIYQALPSEQYFNLFARGFAVDAGAGFSVILGVLSTQTYVQAILSGSSHQEARKGALISAAIIPPVGLGAILVGQYMFLTQPGLNPGLALPRFVMENFPPLLSGILLATLLITVTGTGAGLSLGFATTLTNNIYLRFTKSEKTPAKTLLVMRSLIVFALVTAFIFTRGELRAVILTWGFLSMALRGAVLFVPLCAALFLRQRVSGSYVIASSILGLGTVVLGQLFFTWPVDPLLMGIIVAGCTVLAGVAVRVKEKA